MSPSGGIRGRAGEREDPSNREKARARLRCDRPRPRRSRPRFAAWRDPPAPAPGRRAGASGLRPFEYAAGILTIGFAQVDVDPFLPRGWHVLPDVIGPDRQLAVTTIDQHRELDLCRPAGRGDGGGRGPPRAP